MFQNSGELEKFIAELEAAEKRYSQTLQTLRKDAQALQKVMKGLSTTTSQQRDEIEKGAKQTEQISKELEKYTALQSDAAVKLAAVRNAKRQLNQVNKLEAKLLASAEGSYNALSAQYSLNKIRLNQMSKAQREATKEGQELEKQTREIYEEMNQLQKATGKYTLQVGDYRNELGSTADKQKKLAEELEKTKREFQQYTKSGGDAADITEQYNERIQKLTKEVDRLGVITGKTSKDFKKGFVDNLVEADGAIGDAVRGVKGLGKSFRALLANPVVLVFSAIVATLNLLVSAFTRSEKGARLLSKGMAVIDGAMSLVTGLVDTLITGFEKLFSDPLPNLKDFGKSVTENILNRFKAIPKLISAASRAIGSILKGDFDAARDAAKDFGQAGVQAISGLDEADQELALDGLEKLKDRIDDNTKSFTALDAARLRVRKTNRDLVRSIEELTTAEQTSQAIADDTTKSFKEREEAAQSAREATEARAAKEIELARNNLKLINTEIGLRRKNGEEIEDLLDRQIEAYREVRAAERELTLSRINNERTQSELQQDRLERDLDILIDGFDNQKSINERRLNDDRLTLAERKAIFEETAKLADDSFAKQIATIQKFTGIQVKANELIAESDAVALNQKIRSLGLSEIIEGRLLEIVRERRTAIQDLAEAEQELASKQQEAAQKALLTAEQQAIFDFNLLQKTEVEKQEFAIQKKRETLEAIQALNEQFGDSLPPIDTTTLENSIRQLESNITAIKKQAALDRFEQEQDLRESEFSLLESSEREKAAFQLESERAKLQKILDLNEQFGSELTDVQVQTIRNQIDAINAEIAGLGKAQVNDIYDVFGLQLDGERKQALNESFGYVKQLYGELTQARVDAANRMVEASRSEVDQAQRALDAEINLRSQGYAHSVETAKAELAQAKANQDKALREQRKAARAQAAIQTLEQSSSLVTASAKIWSSFSGLGPVGPVLAIGAIGAMWGSFAAAKIRAAQLAKQEFGEGGLEILGGGSHASGNDTFLGFHTSEGRAAYGERGEAHAIIPARTTRKYRGILPDIVDSLRRGDFEQRYQKLTDGQGATDAANQYVIPGVGGMSTTRMEGELSAIRKQGEARYYKDTDGNLIEERGNLKRRYVKA